jgi:hypothetical protein
MKVIWLICQAGSLMFILQEGWKFSLQFKHFLLSLIHTPFKGTKDAKHIFLYIHILSKAATSLIP